MLPRLCLLTLGLAATTAWSQTVGLDSRFGPGGVKAYHPPTAGNSESRGLATCAGPESTLNVVAQIGTTELATLRLLPNGQVDTRFSGDGVESVFPTMTTDTALVGTCIGGGAVLVARMVRGTDLDRNIEIVKLQQDGRFDTSFGDGGKRLLDLDAHITGLGLLEVPFNINVGASNEIYITGQVTLEAAGQLDPFVARLTANGTVTDVRRVSVPNFDTYYASAAGIGVDGRLWVAGTGRRLDPNTLTWYKAELDPASGALLGFDVGTTGNVFVGAGRVLPNGIMALAARFRPQNSPDDPYRPRMLVLREAGNSMITLPDTPVVDGRPSTIGDQLYSASIIPIANGRVLYGAAVRTLGTPSRTESPDPLRSEENAYLGTYVSVIELGDAPAQDHVYTEFGSHGALFFAYGGNAPCGNGLPPSQFPTRFSNWQGKPVMVGSTNPDCSSSQSNILVARMQGDDTLFADDFGG
ncbi:hypothetical protein [Tahibacter amnicola]|uniref:Delta-60 repeat protein n=1 Tax=Tahibacter amnicola TaxID=2976241 RepID=A0ABY6BFK4_9GAMM|nr:hypothetical protein [Tahibacter amnicola]UXI68808.1 hypothetical protein N4264_03900 [Tahibacter amnicola]